LQKGVRTCQLAVVIVALSLYMATGCADLLHRDGNVGMPFNNHYQDFI